MLYLSTQVVRSCLLHIIHKGRYISSSRRSIFFRAAHNAGEMEAYCSALCQLRALMYLAQRLLHDNGHGNLFFQEESGLSQSFVREYASMHKGCFYGRCLGFQVRLLMASQLLRSSALSLTPQYYSDSIRELLRGNDCYSLCFSVSPLSPDLLLFPSHIPSHTLSPSLFISLSLSPPFNSPPCLTIFPLSPFPHFSLTPLTFSPPLLLSAPVHPGDPALPADHCHWPGVFWGELQAAPIWNRSVPSSPCPSPGPAGVLTGCWDLQASALTSPLCMFVLHTPPHAVEPGTPPYGECPCKVLSGTPPRSCPPHCLGLSCSLLTMTPPPPQMYAPCS